MRFPPFDKFISAGRAWLQAHPWDAGLMLLLGLVGLVVGLWASRIILDDALITFRVAENLAYGRGFVYNVGERVQVTTTPLYAILLAGGTWLTGSALRAATVFNLGLATLIPILAYDVGRRLSGWVTGVASALLLSLSPLLIISFSMESYLYVALILASMSAYLAGRHWPAGLLLGLTALVRGDGALLGACLLTYDTLAYRHLHWRLILPAIGLPLLWYLFATGYYGNPFPATLGAKVAQGEFNWLGQGFASGFYAYWDDWVREKNLDAFRLVPGLMVLGLGPLLRSERRGLIMVGRDLLYVAAFVGLGVPAAEWYYAPVMPGVALLTGRGIQLLAEAIYAGLLRPLVRATLAPKLKPGLSVVVMSLALAVLLTTFYQASALIVAENPDWKAQIYPDTARWLAENTNAAANFATIDIGHLGYWSGRRIIDIVGLAQPDVAVKIAGGDFGYAIRHYQPDMVLIGFTWLPEIQSQVWFQRDYVVRRYFNYPGFAEPLLLLSRRTGVKVQPEAPPPSLRQPLDVDFNRQIKLTGYHVTRPLPPGMPLTLTLFWQATAPIEVDFTVFVQLVDQHNTIVAQKDSKPQTGFYSTPYWQPGETIIDVHALPLKFDVPPGTYDLLIGLYEIESGARLQILDEQGQFQSDSVRLQGITILSE